MAIFQQFYGISASNFLAFYEHNRASPGGGGGEEMRADPVSS